MDYEFHFGPNILYLEFKDAMKADSVENAVKEIRESFPNTNIEVVAYKNILGYWPAYHIKSGHSIYCGTRSLKNTRESITKYLENETENSSN